MEVAEYNKPKNVGTESGAAPSPIDTLEQENGAPKAKRAKTSDTNKATKPPSSKDGKLKSSKSSSESISERR